MPFTIPSFSALYLTHIYTLLWTGFLSFFFCPFLISVCLPTPATNQSQALSSSASDPPQVPMYLPQPGEVWSLDSEPLVRPIPTKPWLTDLWVKESHLSLCLCLQNLPPSSSLAQFCSQCRADATFRKPTAEHCSVQRHLWLRAGCWEGPYVVSPLWLLLSCASLVFIASGLLNWDGHRHRRTWHFDGNIHKFLPLAGI